MLSSRSMEYVLWQPMWKDYFWLHHGQGKLFLYFASYIFNANTRDSTIPNCNNLIMIHFHIDRCSKLQTFQSNVKLVLNCWVDPWGINLSTKIYKFNLNWVMVEYTIKTQGIFIFCLSFQFIWHLSRILLDICDL